MIRTMWNALRQFLGIRPEATALRAATPALAPLPPLPPIEAAPPPRLLSLGSDSELGLDARFSARLLGVEFVSAEAIAESARSVLARLNYLTRAPLDAGLVPRLPAALPRLMSLARRDDCSVPELARHISSDPALLGEVIRLANSPRYRSAREISSLEDAVMLLGQTGLTQLVSRVMLGPVFSTAQGHFSRSAGTHLWAQAERCAHGCAFLRQGRGDQFEAYLAGMVVNAGMIAALRVLDQDYRALAAPASPGFHAALHEVTARLSAHVARLWDFPPEVVAALTQRAAAIPQIEAGSLAEALVDADRLSKLQMLGAPADAPELALTAAQQRCWRELERAFGS